MRPPLRGNLWFRQDRGVRLVDSNLTNATHPTEIGGPVLRFCVHRSAPVYRPGKWLRVEQYDNAGSLCTHNNATYTYNLVPGHSLHTQLTVHAVQCRNAADILHTTSFHMSTQRTAIKSGPVLIRCRITESMY